MIKNNLRGFGFTLVELMIAVVIIGLLAAVGIPAYQKYIIKSKSAEALIKVRNAYDASVISAGREYTSSSGGNCSYNDKFIPIATLPSDNSSCTIASFNYIPPAGVKRYICHLFLTKTYISQTCPPNPYNLFGTESTLSSPTTQSPSTPIMYLGPLSESPGYYLLRGGRSSDIATEYGVDISNTFLITALGDLDGDFSGTGAYSMGGGFGSDPLTVAQFSTFSRGIYIDANGEIQGTAAIYKTNPGE